MAYNIKASIFLLIFVAAQHFVVTNQEEKLSATLNLDKKCGYASCPKLDPTKLNVHIVPHTHDDVGWVKTIDEYYHDYIGVEKILNSVIGVLLKEPSKRFVYVESAFFFMWWDEQTTKMQEQVKQLVNEGRLEFIGGAWSMNDEATTHYQSIIDQFAWGLRRLNDTFGECGRPRIGWQIDPFGHSREMASILAQMGYDGLFFGRLDYQDKKERLRTKKAEMIWRASANLDKAAHIFTGALYNQYQSPPGFCWDIVCADGEIYDIKSKSKYNNVNEIIDRFFEFVSRQRQHYRTNNILITMGGDFAYKDATKYYRNMDKLIRYGNERQANNSKINLLYSTPSCYLKALHDANISWPNKYDDFFPYASEPHAYWTGYYTSRPTLKRYERVGNHFLQVCKQITSFIQHKDPKQITNLISLRKAMGELQHHDAVSGTEKQVVAFDYALRLSRAMQACSSNTRDVLNRLTNGNKSEPTAKKSKDKNWKFNFVTCHNLNISQCNVSETNDNFILTLYNPLAHETTEYIRVPVPHLNYTIRDSKNIFIQSQVVPICDQIVKLKYRKSKAKYELIFLANELPPLGYKSYYIAKSKIEGHHLPPAPQLQKTSGSISIGNEYINLTFDSKGFLSTLSINGTAHNFNQRFGYYESMGVSTSGAYIFRPTLDNATLVSKQTKNIVYRGDLVEEVHQTFNEWISQVVRVYKKQKSVEFEWLVGPIPIQDDIGKDIISSFSSDIESNGIFYTDSNGREMMKRKRDHRDTWNITLEERAPGNYYPVTTKITLQDNSTRMSLLTDRAQGGTSMLDGSLELMIHRRLLYDDNLGVGEALNETAFGAGLIARGVHYLFVGSSKLNQSPTIKALERFTQLQMQLPTWKFFSNANDISYEEWLEKYKNRFSAISVALPMNVHLMSFEPWHDNEVLVRFEHILEKHEDPEFSKLVKFNLKEVFADFDIVDIRETTLDGNAWNDGKADDSKFIIELGPMQMRTFVLFVKKSIL